MAVSLPSSGRESFSFAFAKHNLLELAVGASCSGPAFVGKMRCCLVLVDLVELQALEWLSLEMRLWELLEP